MNTRMWTAAALAAMAGLAGAGAGRAQAEVFTSDEAITISRTAGAPTGFSAAAGKRLVLSARFGPRVRARDVELRIVLRRPDGTLTDRVIPAVGAIGR